MLTAVPQTLPGVGGITLPSNVLPLRPRTVTDPVHAGRILELAPRHRAVLPRWGINSPIRCHEPDPGTYSGTIGWWSREHYLSHVIPAALTVHRALLKHHGVEPDTFRRWAHAKTLYAQDEDTGRKVIVRPVTLANLLQITTRQVQRCNAAARQMGIELVITPGRMLSEIEVYKARKAGSPQRGLSTVTAFVTPRDLVDHVTPTRGEGSSAHLETSTALKTSSAGHKSAPLRSAPHQRRRGPAWTLAQQLTEIVPWLRRCPPGRIQGQLSRFVITCPYPWKATEILRAMDTVNLRANYNSPTRATSAPWALLKWYLDHIDEISDAPGLQRAMDTQERRRR